MNCMDMFVQEQTNTRIHFSILSLLICELFVIFILNNVKHHYIF